MKFLAKLRLAVVGCLLAIATVVAISGNTATAATNNFINFQARLLNTNGSVALDGNYNVSFHLFDVQSGSSGSTDTACGSDAHCLWSETYTVAGSNSVRVAGGYLSVQLGSSTSFPSTINWDQQLYLTMDIGGTAGSPTWDGQMLSSGNRLPLTGVPYAFRAGALAAFSGSNTTTLSLQSPTASGVSFIVPNTGTSASTAYNICTSASSATCSDFAAATGASGYIQNQVASLQQANFRIQSAASGSIAATITGASGQSVDIFDVATNAANVLTVGSTGVVAFENASDSAVGGSGFTIANSKGTQILGVDTADLGVNVTNLQATGTISLQNGQGASIQLRTVSASSAGLTASGGLMTDSLGYTAGNSLSLSRASNLQGDGIQAPDSSFGFWETTTNLVTNGGFESNTSGWVTTGSNTSISQDATTSKFGSGSMKVVTSPAASSGGASTLSANGSRIALSANTAYTTSFWIKGDTASNGTSMRVILREYDASNTQVAQNQQLFTLTNSWQRITYTRTTTSTTASGFAWVLDAGTTAQTFWVDGAQVEQKTTATPYVETNGSSQSRAEGKLSGPSAALTINQGWVSARVRMGFASTASLNATNAVILSFDDGTNNERIQLLWSASGQNWQVRRCHLGNCDTLPQVTDTFNTGDIRTITMRWDTATNNKIYLSINGASFGTGNAIAQTPTGINNLVIGTSGTGNNSFNGDIFWVATGTGLLTDSDATTLYKYGNSDPTLTLLQSLNSNTAAPTLVWKGATTQYASSLASFTNQSQLSIDDVNLTHSGNGAITLQGATNSTAAFQVQNASGSSVFTVDTTNGRVGIGAAPATAVLTIGTNSTGNTGGIIFGTDTSAEIYRSAAGTISTNANLTLINTNLTGLNNIVIGDSGPSEGLSWADNSFIIDSTPLDRSNVAGNLNLYGTSNNIAIWRPVLFVSNATNYATATAGAGGSLAFTNTGTGGFSFKQGTDSTNAFAVQNATGNVLSVDGSGAQVLLGAPSSVAGKLVFNNATTSNTVTLVSATGSSGTITLPGETGTVCTTASTGVCNTAGGLSNVAYLNGANAFTNTNTITVDSSNAFSVKNTAGNTPLNVDTTNSLVSVTNLQSSGTISLQGPDGGSILLHTAANSGTGSSAMTFSGNEITDYGTGSSNSISLARASSLQGDGRAPDDSSTGIWEGTTNLITNGGFESNTTGWGASGSGTNAVTRDTTKSKFGAASTKVVTDGTAATQGVATSSSISVTASQTYTASAWVYVPTGTIKINIEERDASDVFIGGSQTNVSASSSWQRVSVTRPFGSTGVKARVYVTTTGTNQALTWWVDGVQLEQKPIATPYVETNGASASRTAASVQAPSASLNATQGWFAVRVAPGWSSTSAPNSFPTVFRWQLDSNNRLIAYWQTATQKWVFTRLSGGTGNGVLSAAQTFNADDPQTLVFAWDAGHVYLSVNGGAFASTANTSVPAGLPATFSILMGDNLFDGRALWTAAGNGALSDADASNIYKQGNSDPTISSLNSIDSAATPIFAWDGEGGQYSGTNNSPILQSGISIDDVNLYHSGNGSLVLQGSTNSTTAFQVQSSSGSSILTVDTADGQVAVGPNAVPANGVLTVGTNTTTASGGIYFGTDTDLYRSGGGSLTTDATTLNLGTSASTSNEALTVQGHGNAALVLSGDTDNDAGEVGTGYIQFVQDGGATQSFIGNTQAASVNPMGTTFTGALNNGLIIGTQQANSIQLGVNNSAGITLDSSNNVGIGTTSPSGFRLNVSGNTNITGTLAVSSTINTNTFDATHLTFSGASPTITNTGTGTVTLQAAAAGTLLLNTGGAGTVSLGTTNTTTIGIGSSASTNTILGNTAINTSGSATTGIGNSSAATTITGNTSSSITFGSNFTVATSGAVTAADNINISNTAKAYQIGGSNLLTNSTLSFTAASNATVQAASSQNLLLKSGDTSHNVLLQSTGGNVGIGLAGGAGTTPQAALDINGGVSIRGYATTNTSNTFNGQWTQLGVCTIATQFNGCDALIQIVGGTANGSAGGDESVQLNWRVKQQNALGGVPTIQLEAGDFTGTSGISVDDFVAVTTQNDASATVVQLWAKVDATFQQWHFTPTLVEYPSSTGSFNFLSTQTFSASLPAGTQTAAIYRSFQAGSNSTPSITFAGNLNTGIYQPATNVIGFTNNGTENIAIDASGNLNVINGSLQINGSNVIDHSKNFTGGTVNTDVLDATHLTFSGSSPIITSSVANSDVSLLSNGSGTLTLDSGASGTVSLGVNATTVNLGSGSVTRTINLGASSGNSTINVGNAGGTDVVNLLTDTGTNSFNVGAASGSTTAVNINSNATLNLGNNNVNKTINLGVTGATANTTAVNIGTSTGAAQTIAIGSANASSTFSVEAGTGTTSLFNGGTAHTIQLATGAAIQNVTIGSTNSSSALTLQAGTGNLNIGNDSVAKTTTINIGADATGADVIALGSTNASSTVNIEGGTAANSIKIGNGTTAHSIAIGNGGTAAQTVNIGSTSSTSSTTINAGVNGSAETLQLQVAASGFIGIGTANSTKTIDIGSVGSTAGASTIHIADTSTTSNNQSVIIGSNAAANHTLQLQGGNSNTTGLEAVRIQTAAAGGIAIGTAAQTGTITLGQATTATTQTINIESANGTSSTQTINIGAGSSTTAGGKVVNIATGTPGASTANTIQIGTGGTSGAGLVGVTIGSNTAAAHTTVIQGGNGAGAITLNANGGNNTGTIVKTVNSSTLAFQIQNSSSQALFTADTVHQQVAIGPAAVPANGALTIGTNTTTNSGGLYFGTDTFLYRSNPNELTSSGKLVVTTSVTTPLINTASGNLQIQPATGLTQFNTASIDNEIRIYGSGGSNYASLSYNNATSSAILTTNSGTVKVGSGSGPINILAGAGAAITMTANAASTWQTTSGILTLQGAGGLSFGSPIVTDTTFKETSTTAVQIQNGSGTTVFDADTSNMQLLVSNTNPNTATSISIAVTSQLNGPGAQAIGSNTPAIAMGSDGFPRMAYFDTGNNKLQFVHCLNTACTSDTTTTIDSTVVGASGDKHLFINIASDGFARITYLDSPISNINYVQCGNADCTSPTITTVANDNFNDISATIGSDDNGRIVYSGPAGETLIICTNAACSTKTTNVFDATSSVTLPVIAMASSDGCPRVAYSDQAAAPEAMHLVRFSGTAPACATVTNTVVETQTQLGLYGIGLDVTSSGFPQIAYDWYNGTSFFTRFADCLNAACTSKTITSLSGIATNAWGQPTSVSLRMGSDGFARMIADGYDYVQCKNLTCSSNTETLITQTAGTFLDGFAGQDYMVIGSDGFPRIASLTPGNSINYIQCADDACASTSFSVPPAPSPSSNNMGQYSSIAMGKDNYPRMTYYDATEKSIVYVRCLNSTCSTSTNSAVGYLSSNTVKYSSIVIGSDGFARILAEGQFSGQLILYGCLNADCSNVTSNQVASSADYPSMALNSSGNPVYAYYKTTTSALMYGTCTDSYCTSSSSNTVDSSVAGVGLYSKVAMASDGFARISYYDNVNHDLKFAQCTNTACTTHNLTSVDTTGDVGKYTSLAMGSDGFARISYYDVTNADLKFTQCTNAACSTSNSNTIDSTGDVGQYTSLAMGSDGFARISYYDVTNADLKLVVCSNSACTAKSTNSVDSTGSVGQYTSITIGADGKTRISYYDATNTKLKLFIQIGTTTTALGINLGTSSNIFANVNVAVLQGATALIKPSTDVTTAFQVQSSGGTVEFTVDTTNNLVVIGSESSSPTILVLGIKNDTASDPTTCTNGGVYYNSVSENFRGCAGGTWQSLNSGAQLDYAQITSNVSVPLNSETLIVSGNSVNYDGNTPVEIEFSCSSVVTGSSTFTFHLFEDGNAVNNIGQMGGQGRLNCGTNEFFTTPTAGPHTFSIEALSAGSAATVDAGTGSGGTGNYTPAFIRITVQ